MAISLNDVRRGYERWAAKPHNAKWVRKIDGTPIANDIVVNIFESLKDNHNSAKGLVWVEHREASPAPQWSAQTPFGFYDIEEISASDCPAYEVRLHAHHLIAITDGLDEAKAVAQADYERRIISALTLNDDPGNGGDGEGERKLSDLIDRYWQLAYAEGVAGATTDTETGDAEECRIAIDATIAELRARCEKAEADLADMTKDYLRRHNDAVDRWIELEMLKPRIAEIRAAALEEAAKTALAYSPYDYGDSPAAKYFYEVRVKDAVNEIAAAIRALIPEREG